MYLVNYPMTDLLIGFSFENNTSLSTTQIICQIQRVMNVDYSKHKRLSRTIRK
jgi:hypothetical protein